MQLNAQLSEIKKEKENIEKEKNIINEKYEEQNKRELEYLTKEEKLEKRKKILDELLNKVNEKELENKQKAKEDWEGIKESYQAQIDSNVEEAAKVREQKKGNK